MIEILTASPFASVQDSGRNGFRAQGVSIAGAMDQHALHSANLLVGNDADAAGIETTAGPLKLRFTRATLFAVTGAASRVTLDGVAVPCHWCQPADQGQVLEIVPLPGGMWTYLALSGAIDCPPVLGSRSTDFKIGLGGPNGGKPLAAGMTLALGEGDSGRLRAVAAIGGFGTCAPAEIRDENGHRIIRVIPAREYDQFVPDAQQAFWDKPWQVGRESNRMGYRLSGPELATARPQSLPSYGIVPGVVQVPPGGQPIVQLAEANTCGGYPKMGVVIQADLPALVQTRPGQYVRMQRVTPQDALAARDETRTRLQQIKAAANMVTAWT